MKRKVREWGWCSQCGKSYLYRACGPTHAIMHQQIKIKRRERRGKAKGEPMSDSLEQARRGFICGQVVALRDDDGSWIYAQIEEFVSDGTVRMRGIDGRRKLKDIRSLIGSEIGAIAALEEQK